MRDRIRILIADRNALVVEALEDLFVELDGGSLVLTAHSLREALTIARREQPELVLIDARMNTDAEHAVRQVIGCSPRSAVFVMATTCDPEFERRMVGAGATGCCEKEAMPARAPAILSAARARQ